MSSSPFDSYWDSTRAEAALSDPEAILSDVYTFVRAVAEDAWYASYSTTVMSVLRLLTGYSADSVSCITDGGTLCLFDGPVDGSDYEGEYLAAETTESC